MDLTKIAFLILLCCAGVERLIELSLSRRHQLHLARLGARKQADPCYPWMIALHVTVLAVAGLEVMMLHRPCIVPLASIALLFFVLATLLRWWVIRTLGTHWNTQVMDSAPLGVVSSGPFRWVRHPNYLAVFVEMTALPLIHTAWITALASAFGNALVLHRRLQVEEGVLATVPAYRAAMAGKPRFLPRLF